MSETVIITLIANMPSMLLALASLLVAVKSLLTIHDVDRKVNGHLSELLKLTVKEEHAKGVAEGLRQQ